MFEIKDPDHPLARLSFPLAAAAPAALFAFLWRGLNADFLPYIGEGFHSVQVCFFAGVAFWLWTLAGLRTALKEHPEGATVTFYARQVYWRLVASVLAIPLGRVVFSILPPWDNSFGAVIGLFIGNMFVSYHFEKTLKSRFVHSRGTVLLPEEEAKRIITALPRGSEPTIKWAGINLPGEVAEGNLLSAGAIGTGKTRMHRELMASILPSIRPGSDRRMLIYDVKCDLLTELYGMRPEADVFVFNPFDKRSVAWDIAGDVETPIQARHFAEALILPPKDAENLFFSDAARAIVAGVINALNRVHPREWDLRRLIRITAKRERLERALAGSDLIDQFFSPPETFSNVINTIANALVPLEPVAALWQRTASKISLRDWVRSGDSILVLGGKEDLQASLQPINRVAFKMISTAFLSEPESPRRARLWFFCDELKIAGRLDSLPALLNARSKGVRCVLGFQDLEGLVIAYGGRESPKEILHRCTTVTWLKLTSTDTAKWASERSGEVERYEYLETQSKDKEKSTGEHLTKREAIIPSQFLNLPDFAMGNVNGFHLIKGVNGVFNSSAHYSFSKGSEPDFDPRPSSEQFLAPWDDADDNWLDGGRTPRSSEPPPTDPDPGSFGRIDF